LSGGNQQRVVLAKWMAAHPRLLILDSPTVGVDVAARDGIYRIIRHLASEGVAILLITDEIAEVLNHSHRIAVMAGVG
jgi:simple sugar transport system ATP-binding protein